MQEWNICPKHWDKNFKCELTKGSWSEEKGKGLGYNKWLLIINKIGKKDCPTFADQRNFISGLLECELRNDAYKFKEGHSRKPCKGDTLRKFKEVIEDIELRFNELKLQKPIEFYLEKIKNERE